MLRRTYAFFEGLMDAAPALVVPFGRGRSYLVPRDKVHEVRSGIITMSPIACFLQECGFAWNHLNHRAEIRRLNRSAR